MTVSASGRIQFAAGHRVYGHEGKCRFLHGHNYVVLAEAIKSRGAGLDELGRVIDFGVLRRRLGEWIETAWDHGFILSEVDTEAIELLRQMRDQKLYVLPGNPTAENLAAYLVHEVCPRLFAETAVDVVSVTIWETENCMAKVCA